jgi:hypothetical protein
VFYQMATKEMISLTHVSWRKQYDGVLKTSSIISVCKVYYKTLPDWFAEKWMKLWDC